MSYIMINTDTPIRSRFPGISSFPVGTTINFVVSLHDDVGEQFHATKTTIRFHLNKSDFALLNLVLIMRELYIALP